MSRKVFSDQSTRSILLMATTMLRMPSSEARKLWRRVCTRMPLRASTNSTATSAVDEQGEVEVVALGTHLLRIDFQRRELVLEEHFRFVEQPADHGALAVVHAAAGDEAQQSLALVGLEVGLDVLGEHVGYVCHQKYPSCFFFSMDPAESWSIIRPCRSEVLHSSISWMIFGRVSASDSTAP